jgi:hypothetical protein
MSTMCEATGQISNPLPLPLLPLPLPLPFLGTVAIPPSFTAKELAQDDSIDNKMAHKNAPHNNTNESEDEFCAEKASGKIKSRQFMKLAGLLPRLSEEVEGQSVSAAGGVGNNSECLNRGNRRESNA